MSDFESNFITDKKIIFQWKDFVSWAISNDNLCFINRLVEKFVLMFSRIQKISWKVYRTLFPLKSVQQTFLNFFFEFGRYSFYQFRFSYLTVFQPLLAQFMFSIRLVVSLGVIAKFIYNRPFSLICDTDQDFLLRVKPFPKFHTTNIPKMTYSCHYPAHVITLQAKYIVLPFFGPALLRAVHSADCRWNSRVKKGNHVAYIVIYQIY